MQILSAVSSKKFNDMSQLTSDVNGLQAALATSGNNNLLEARLFAFGNGDKPLPVYNLRAAVLNPSYPPFAVVKSSTGSGKTIMFPAFLYQLDLAGAGLRRVYVTQPTTMTM